MLYYLYFMESCVYQRCVSVSAVFAYVLHSAVLRSKQATRYSTSSTQHWNTSAFCIRCILLAWSRNSSMKAFFWGLETCVPLQPLLCSASLLSVLSPSLPACRLSPSSFVFMYYVCLDSCLSNDGKTIIRGSCLLGLSLGRPSSNGTRWKAEGGGCSHCRVRGAACPQDWLQRPKFVHQPIFWLF